jgi:hypothetical protein
MPNREENCPDDAVVEVRLLPGTTHNIGGLAFDRNKKYADHYPLIT